MKIISKYKDYYDYLQGIYGVDERLVLDRRKSDHQTYHSNGVYHFLVGALVVEVLYVDGKFYCGESDIIKLGGTKIVKSDGTFYHRVPYQSYNKKEIALMNINPYPRDEKKYSKFDELAICEIYYAFGQLEAVPYPRLEQYGIQKALNPHDAWLSLSEWLGTQISKREPEVPVGDDKVRIVSAGFDLKTSFRNVK